MLNYAEHLKVEAAITEKARELLGDVPPEFNIWPTRELIRQAWAQGYDLVKTPKAAHQPALNSGVSDA
jgi:hypothetical protein